ncbi:MAG: virulence factor [Thalassobaculum sp.]|uniref:virulence factor n=1 Tax=Thalassobaculum sp. TaxID=2022740 RepID=UPI0032EC8108
MASLIVTYWRDIPAQVVVEKGRGRQRDSAKVELPNRFIAAIDAAAMRGGAEQADSYLDEWRRSDPVEVPDDGMEATVQSKAAELEAAWPAERLRAAIAAGGWERD